jgi:serine/threonine protein kinase
MNLGRYRLLAQRGAGADGVSYRANDPEGQSDAEIRVLGGARAAEARWNALVKRLRLAAMLDHAGAIPIRALQLDHDPPYVALDWSDPGSLAAALHQRVPLPVPEAVRLGADLAAVLTAAHRLGLVHGCLCPADVRWADGGTVRLDFTGIAADAPPDRQIVPDVDVSCRAPERAESAVVDAAADVYGLGALLTWLATGKPAHPGMASPISQLPGLDALLGRMLAPDPVARPTGREVMNQLGVLLAAGATQDAGVFEPESIAEQRATRDGVVLQAGGALPLALAGSRLGRFRLLELLGEGGLGKVYRAEDVTDGTVVALKVLHPHLADRPSALRRFRKEARLLAEVKNPYVANLIEVNEDQGIHYLALEFVTGKSLGRIISETRRLDERLALAVMADVARALVDAHRRGIVHRDVKPDNIMFEDPFSRGSSCATSAWPGTWWNRRR